MISGLIIYNELDIERNKWFITKCLNVFNNELFSLKLIDEKSALDNVSCQKVDFVINRSRNHSLVKRFEEQGVLCFNNSFTNEIANDKSKTFNLLKEHEIECVESLPLDAIDEYPFIMKSVDGHGGKEVFLLNSKEETEEIAKKSHKKYVYQKYLKNSGDLRVYVLGNSIIGAVLRHNKQDFRSNYSLGGEVEDYLPNFDVIETSLKIGEILNADFIGVDFLKIGDDFIVNEIEDPVGSRMLLQVSGTDAVSLFIDYIKDKLLHK